jgi:hypothetical protein
MESALTTASTAISSARTVMNFTRHFIAGPPIAMLPGAADGSHPLLERVMCPCPRGRSLRSDHTAKLYGHVHSLHEAAAARSAAAAAPGVATVESHLLVPP